jgi:hypothetical protein
MTALAWRRVIVAGVVVVLLAAALVVGRLATSSGGERDLLPRAAEEFLGEADGGEREGQDPDLADRDFAEGAQGIEVGGAGDEAAELKTALDQYAEARTAPGIVDPGAYSAAFAQMTGLPVTGGSWSEVTTKPYDADDPNFRDYWSNSSGGSGLVTGRITGLAADADGYVYAAGADGGVWRSSTGGRGWTPIADSLPSLSSGDLQLAEDGSLWYATGEANTGGTSYVGSGVYRLGSPRTGTFSPGDRVGEDELESATINAIRFDGNGLAWVATLRGIYYHSTTTTAGAWVRSFAPNVPYLPGGAKASDPNAAYKNIVNDLAIDPKNPAHIVAGVGWRGGDSYNGFYETFDAGTGDHWTKVNPTGAINPKEIGNVSFAFAGDGSKLYVMNESTILYAKPTGTVNSYLDGIYVSKNGSVAGPWTKVAEQRKLANSGSALKQSVGGKGYGPGIQSWYNQFLIVDPAKPDHVYAGLEEVYESKNGGSSWTTVGPYWNFYFSCWAPDSVYPPDPDGPNRCPQTTHPDQHSAAVGTYDGTTYIFVGNDGGIYRRPIDGQTNRNGNATDWESLNDGTIGALQYYAVGVGNANPANERTPEDGDGPLVSGGLQDNGGSIYRIGGDKMSSNFGGDGGDVLVDPNDGCNIVGEYVVLTMYVTQTCANPDPTTNPNAFLDPNDATTFTIAPPDINARFIAPFVADANNIQRWLAGGNSIWFNDIGFDIRSGSEWKKVYTFADPGKVATSMAYTGDTAVAGWCGPCNNAGFTRGVAIGTFDGTDWQWTEAPGVADLPNRYVGGAAVDADGNVYVVMNGFSRRFTEGPGAGVGHVFVLPKGGSTWQLLDGSGNTAFPDVPSNSIKVLSNGALAVGTDLGVMYSSDHSTWSRLGDGLPVTTVLDVEVAPVDDHGVTYLYAATHGRGIWRFDLASL